ncbi:centromere/kinetochore protein zw10 homolog isoform X2 [Ascaphus truei]|uniref:centromere/kinetochore protein zw10 homolog isoform X2 n=1 Tax=Ascaphus truei TaxID=8439 RepID=UPI003F5A27B3
MASFVTEVLAHSGRLGKEDLGTKISRLSLRVEEVKGDVCNLINKKYDEFLPSLQSAEALVTEVQGLVGDVDVLKSRIENEVQGDLRVAITEFTELKQQLEKNTVILSVLQQLQEFDSIIEKYKCSLTERNYIAAAQHLEKAQSSMNGLKSRKGCDLKLLKALEVEMIVQKQNMLYNLGEEWRQLAVWKLPQGQEPSAQDMVMQTELHLYTPPSSEDAVSGPLLGSLLQAFAILGELHTKLKCFSQLLLNYILKPLVTYPSLHARVDTQPHGVVLRFELEEMGLEHPLAADVFVKLKLVLEVLHKHLLDVPVEEFQLGEGTVNVVLAEVLGDLIWEDLSGSIIKDCLVYSIPNSSSKLEQYKEVIKYTEEFENALIGMKYLKGETTDLLRYARNVNGHFASKKCQDVIVTARNLMTSEMHNTVKITPESKVTIPKLPSPRGADKAKSQKVSNLVLAVPALENAVRLSQHTTSLPACRISESVEKLMELTYLTLSEAATSSKPCGTQLFYTVKNLFQLFYDVVPVYHKENLQKLPQLSAIHHNNCMYIAHHLLTLGHQFHTPFNDGDTTFVDLVPGFRKLGKESFRVQISLQEEELLERLSSARNFRNMEEEENYTAAHKAIRQVIHQLSHLGKVWQDVLPVCTYCRAMGNLLNLAVDEMISKIAALEDISTEDGERLYALCLAVIEEGALLFTPLPEESKNKKYQEEVPLYVPKWMKFKELMMILQASLQDIVDRWADRKGPLAMEFSTNEVKSLIRALFQNTERRAAALARIK